MNVESDWCPAKSRVDESRFEAGSVGPYRLGMHVRATALGEITLAIHEAIDVVVEIDTFDALARSPHVGPDGRLMADLAEIARVSHPHVAPVIGAGIEAGAPYVVRPHRLGRTLDELFRVREHVSPAFAACVTFALADALAHLAGFGPSLGSCSLGGFDARDVHLGYEGTISLIGTGLKLVRSPQSDATEADRRALVVLVGDLDRRAGSELADIVRSASKLEDAARQVRRAHRESLAKRAGIIGGTLRELFDDAIREERAFFNLAPLQ